MNDTYQLFIKDHHFKPYAYKNFIYKLMNDARQELDAAFIHHEELGSGRYKVLRAAYYFKTDRLLADRKKDSYVSAINEFAAWKGLEITSHGKWYNQLLTQDEIEDSKEVDTFISAFTIRRHYSGSRILLEHKFNNYLNTDDMLPYHSRVAIIKIYQEIHFSDLRLLVRDLQEKFQVSVAPIDTIGTLLVVCNGDEKIIKKLLSFVERKGRSVRIFVFKDIQKRNIQVSLGDIEEFLINIKNYDLLKDSLPPVDDSGVVPAWPKKLIS